MGILAVHGGEDVELDATHRRADFVFRPVRFATGHTLSHPWSLGGFHPAEDPDELVVSVDVVVDDLPLVPFPVASSYAKSS